MTSAAATLSPSSVHAMATVKRFEHGPKELDASDGAGVCPDLQVRDAFSRERMQLRCNFLGRAHDGRRIPGTIWGGWDIRVVDKIHDDRGRPFQRRGIAPDLTARGVHLLSQGRNFARTT